MGSGNISCMYRVGNSGSENSVMLRITEVNCTGQEYRLSTGSLLLSALFNDYLPHGMVA